MNEIVLTGCGSTPLSDYLKALGVFRVSASQVDPSVKAQWRDGVFVLATYLDRKALTDFFVDRYSPTPIVAPWNGGSGFYEGDQKQGIDAIAESGDPRFSGYRRVIEEVRSWAEMPSQFKSVGDITRRLGKALGEIREGTKKHTEVAQLIHAIEGLGAEIGMPPSKDPALEHLAEMSKKKKEIRLYLKVLKKGVTMCKSLERKDLKGAILPLCRARLPDTCLAWIDAAVALRPDGSPRYNPLLGSGGNDGRLDFSNNYMQHLSDLLLKGDRARTAALLASSLFNEAMPGLVKAPIGQFHPGRAGGFNQGTEIETKDFKINPWDYVLVIEGACLFTGSLAKKSITDPRPFASMPFTVLFSASGFASAVGEGEGKAEIWMPTWPRPASFSEVSFLLKEGRSSIGRRPSRDGLDFTRAAATLGVDRGIDSFTRYVFVKRRGDSYVALPAGRVAVRNVPAVKLLEDADPLLGSMNGFLRSFKNEPGTFGSARRQVQGAMYDCSIRPGPPQFARLVTALGRFEFLAAQRDRAQSPKLTRPLSGLRPRWMLECDDGGVEVRIAASLASIFSTGKIGPIRSNLSGVDPGRPWQWDEGSGQKCWEGSDLVERLCGVLRRRMLDLERLSAPRIPVEGRICLRAADLVPFLFGETDDRKIEDLLWGFTLIDWRKEGLDELVRRWKTPAYARPLPRSWCTLKLLHVPGRVKDETLRPEPRIAPLLWAGNVEEALAVARRRLLVSGLAPMDTGDGRWLDARRQLAALLVPVSDTRLLESLVLME